MKTYRLAASEIAVGHIVIVNEHEAPEGRMLAVITAIEGVNVRCKYLNVEKEFSPYNRSGMVNQIAVTTPADLFGVRVMAEQECSGAEVVYWCELTGESTATYRDGKPRHWQERGWRGRYVARPKIFDQVAKTVDDTAVPFIYCPRCRNSVGYIRSGDNYYCDRCGIVWSMTKKSVQ